MAKRNPLSAAAREEFIKRRREGVTIRALASQFGIHMSTASSILRSAGMVGPRGRPRKFNEEQAKALAREYSSGKSIAELAKEFKASKPTIALYIRKHMPLRTDNRPKKLTENLQG